jgi:hypothetical protein
LHRQPAGSSYYAIAPIFGHARLGCGGILTLDGIVDIASGNINCGGGVAQVDAALNIQLNADMSILSGAFTIPLGSYYGLSIDGGSLDVTLPSGFLPANGEQFQLLYTSQGASITGAFNSVELPSLPDGETWDTSDLYTTGIISVVPEPTSAGLMSFSGMLLLRRRRKRED